MHVGLRRGGHKRDVPEHRLPAGSNDAARLPIAHGLLPAARAVDDGAARAAGDDPAARVADDGAVTPDDGLPTTPAAADGEDGLAWHLGRHASQRFGPGHRPAADHGDPCGYFCPRQSAAKCYGSDVKDIIQTYSHKFLT